MKWPAYPKYKASGIEWLGAVPEHWEVKPIVRVAAAIQTGPFGSQLHESDYVDGGVPLINPAHISSGRFIPDGHSTVDKATAARLRRFHLKAGDIVMGRRGEIGRCAVVSSAESGWICGTGSLLVRLECADPAYLARVLTSSGFRELLELAAVGTTMLNVNPTIVGRARVPVPPLNEQRMIAEFLESQTAKLDALVMKKRALIEKLREKHTALVSFAVTRGLPTIEDETARIGPDRKQRASAGGWLDDVAEHWTIERLKSIVASIEQGWSPECYSRSATDDEWGVVKAGCCNYGVFDPHENKALPIDLAPLSELEIKPGDVLMSRASGSDT